MTPEQFCYWLQGHLEISGSDKLTPDQVMMIKRHLDTVFLNITKDPFKEWREVLRPTYDDTGTNPSWPEYKLIC